MQEIRKPTHPWPTKLSDLLEGAIADCLAAETAGVRFEMNGWLRSEGDVIFCDMAGATMLARGVRPPKNDVLGPDEAFGVLSDDAKKCHAIDAMRIGRFRAAFHLCHNAPCVGESQRIALDLARELVLRSYDSDVSDRASWEVYRQAARVLRAEHC